MSNDAMLDVATGQAGVGASAKYFQNNRETKVELKVKRGRGRETSKRVRSIDDKVDSRT